MDAGQTKTVFPAGFLSGRSRDACRFRRIPHQNSGRQHAKRGSHGCQIGDALGPGTCERTRDRSSPNRGERWIGRRTTCRRYRSEYDDQRSRRQPECLSQAQCFDPFQSGHRQWTRRLRIPKGQRLLEGVFTDGADPRTDAADIDHDRRSRSFDSPFHDRGVCPQDTRDRSTL